jgi:hypothetical protein
MITPELISCVAKTDAIRRLLQLAEYGSWASRSDSMIATEAEQSLVAAGLAERNPSPWLGQLRVTLPGARLADKICSLVRRELEDSSK